MNWPTEFNLSEDHCADVLAGAYEVPYEAKVVLDIGANVGAFARWASERWPSAEIHSYEPQPSNFALLQKTIAHYQLSRVTAHETAVSDKENVLTLFENGFNCGEWSLIKFDKNGNREVTVMVMDAAELPKADFLKIDTEGVEPNILKRLLETEYLLGVNGLVLEYHAAVHVPPIIWMCQQAGLSLWNCSPHMDHRGILKFVR